MAVIQLTTDRAEEVADVLSDAFRDYPVMRTVLGEVPGYPERLRTLVGFFVAGRTLREEPMFGVEDGRGRLVGAAILSWPVGGTTPDVLAERREATWARLGAAERARYEAYGAAAGQFVPAEPHWHLNMIGVRSEDAGTGVGRALLDQVHRFAGADPRSAGVSLATELEQNVGLYQHFGYRVIGHARVVEGLETWALFRGAGRGAP